MKKILFLFCAFLSTTYQINAWIYSFENKSKTEITIDFIWCSLEKIWYGKHERPIDIHLPDRIIMQPGSKEQINSRHYGLVQATLSMPAGQSQYIALVGTRNEMSGTSSLTIDGVYGHALWTIKQEQSPEGNFIGIHFKKMMMLPDELKKLLKT